MTAWIDATTVAVMLLTLAVLGASRLRHVNRLIAAQGITVSILPLLAHAESIPLRAALLAAFTIALKGWAFPRLIDRAILQSGTKREMQPFIGLTASTLAGLALLAAAFWLGSRLTLPFPAASARVVPAALFIIFAGLLLIVSRRTAIAQVLGYLLMENGIYVFGIAAVPHQEFLVEVGMLLDIFVGVFIFGITIFRISREFDHIETDRMHLLRDRARSWH
jgi:hydrogenase-4 component E